MKIAILAAVYVAVARLGLQLDPVSRFATLVWPAAGVSLATLVLFGRHLWPGVALGIACGNTLEAVLGAYLLWRIPGFRPQLDRLVDALGIVAVSVAISVVSATIGVSSLYAGGLMAGSQYGATWLAWWQGDVLGDLVVAPFLLSWVNVMRERMTPARLAEAAVLGVALLGASLLLLGGDSAVTTGLSAFRQPTTLLPVLIWSAVRFGTRGAAGATLLVSLVAVWSTANGRGPFIRPELHQSLSVLQAFMSVVAATFLVLGAVTAERRRVDREKTELYHRERLARAYAEELKNGARRQ